MQLHKFENGVNCQPDPIGKEKEPVINSATQKEIIIEILYGSCGTGDCPLEMVVFPGNIPENWVFRAGQHFYNKSKV